MSTFENFHTGLWMFFIFKLYFALNNNLIYNSIIMVNSIRVFVDHVFNICACLRWHMYLQSAIWFIGRIIYLPKNNFPVLLNLVRWYVYHTSKAASARISIHGSSSSAYVLCRLYVHKRFPDDLFIISMAVFACGLTKEYG